MTVTGTLQPDLINRLQQLIIANQNSFDSLKCAANQLNQKPYWSVVFDIAFQRGLHADILSRILALGGVQPEENGSTAAVDESVWDPLRNVAPQDGPEAILEKAEHSEEHLKQLYAEVIDQGQSNPATGVLQKQYDQVLEGLSQLRDLRAKASREE